MITVYSSQAMDARRPRAFSSAQSGMWSSFVRPVPEASRQKCVRPLVTATHAGPSCTL